MVATSLSSTASCGSTSSSKAATNCFWLFLIFYGASHFINGFVLPSSCDSFEVIDAHYISNVSLVNPGASVGLRQYLGGQASSVASRERSMYDISLCRDCMARIKWRMSLSQQHPRDLRLGYGYALRSICMCLDPVIKFSTGLI